MPSALDVVADLVIEHVMPVGVEISWPILGGGHPAVQVDGYPAVSSARVDAVGVEREAQVIDGLGRGHHDPEGPAFFHPPKAGSLADPSTGIEQSFVDEGDELIGVDTAADLGGNRERERRAAIDDELAGEWVDELPVPLLGRSAATRLLVVGASDVVATVVVVDEGVVLTVELVDVGAVVDVSPAALIVGSDGAPESPPSLSAT